MDQQNKTDQFFRENLDQIEFIPSDNAWNKIQQKIKPAKKMTLGFSLKIAASIAILITSYMLFFFPTPKTKTSRWISDINDPINQEVPTLVIPEHVDKNPARLAINKPLIKHQEIKQQEGKVDAGKIRPISTIEVASIQQVNLDTHIDPQIQLKEFYKDSVLSKSTVKITYIASSSDTEKEIDSDTTKVHLFNKMWSIAQHTSPVEIISGLRDAKDGFIENGFKRN